MAEDFHTVLDETFTNISIQAVNQRLAPLLESVDKIKSKYGRELLDVGIGANAAPPLGAHTRSWKMLGDAWLKRKKASTSRPEYYLGLTGQLQASILAMPTEQIFGKTQLRSIGGVAQSQGFYNPRLRRFVSTVFRDRGGRFARASEAGKKLRVVVDAFPELRTSNSSDIIDKLPIPLSEKMKLEWNNTDRPLMASFTAWFYENRIKFTIEQGLKAL